MAFLEVAQLSKNYGIVSVFQDFDLFLNEKDRLVLIGPSGCGKSTFLRCVMGLESISKGNVRLDGSDYISVSDQGKMRLQRAAQKQIGMVFQHYTLFPHFTVLGNLCLAPVHARGMSKSEARDKAMGLLKRFGLEARADYHPSQLSGGQKQRVAIARALMLDPRLMLFDEVTSALDPELVVEVENTMMELAEAGMPMLIVTHDMHFVRNIATKVAFLEGGKVLEIAPPNELFTKPKEPRTHSFLKTILRFEGSEL
jgi:polar amino acid transport system ATP-binding protein